MIATVDIVDLGAAGTIRSLVRRTPAANEVPGLRWARSVALIPLAATRPPNLRRGALLAFWDDDEHARHFAETHPVGRRFADGDGLHVGMRPIRAFGAWPGLDADIDGARDALDGGPVVVFTMGRLRMSQALRFLRTSRAAERAAVESTGMRWGTASARPPFVATISIWDDGRAAAGYAYGRTGPAHSEAIAEQQRKDFHKRSAFVRFAPVRATGSIDGVAL